MQTATSETESKSRDLSICVHNYTLRAPCPKGQEIEFQIGLYDPTEADLEHFWNCCSEGFLGERLYGCTAYGCTAVLPKIPHCNCSKSAPNRPLWGRM